MVDTLPAVARQVLDRIASGEAGAYNVLYGGHQFDSYHDHPRIKIPLGNGLYSSAAGKYQMIAPTWDKEKAKLGLPDFSPASQDAAAWDLAQSVYREKTGRELADDATRGDVDYSVLQSQWSSLPRPSGPTLSFSSAAQPPPAPPVEPLPKWTSPLDIEHQLEHSSPLGQAPLARPGAGLSLYQGHDFEAVDHNPFAGSLVLEPVSGDPFEKKERTE